MALWVIVPAAGVGARMGGSLPKQYLSLSGQSVLAHTLQRLAQVPGLGRIVVALHPEDPCWHTQLLPPQLPLSTCAGGRERSDSVLSALQFLQGIADEQDWVLVHDAVRPCVRLDDIDRLLQEVESHPCGGLLAVPVSSTLKRSNARGDIVGTLPRDHVWQAATPQAFRLGVLRQALSAARQAGVAITDEASAMELAGHAPRLVRGSADNIKITYTEDLLLAELILAAQQRESATAAR
jgi:2-C-methyl-D-erythritol 4-phosphate cytidylyltransferase